MTEAEKNMTADMESELQGAVESTLKEISDWPIAGRPKATEPISLATARPQTLTEQVNQMQRIEQQIAERLRRAAVEAQAEVQRKITDAHAHHARTVSEMTAKLERERDEAIRQADDAYHARMHELAGLLRRRA